MAMGQAYSLGQMGSATAVALKKQQDHDSGVLDSGPGLGGIITL